MSKTIETILKQGKELHQPYPQTFQALKEAGVQSYEVWLETYDNSYQGTFGTWTETPPEGYVPLIIAEAFSKNTVSDILRRHQKGETTFVEFLGEMASAGVSHSRVDMAQRTVTYYDRQEQNQHQEQVP